MNKDYSFASAAAYGYHPAIYGSHMASPYGYNIESPRLTEVALQWLLSCNLDTTSLSQMIQSRTIQSRIVHFRIPSSRMAICMLNPLKHRRSGIHPSGVGGALLIAEFGIMFEITTLSGLYLSGNMHSGKRHRPLEKDSFC